ncbi:hypothetical protein SELMODRAFT_415011 [Selaginella moellendorffii]|uniref:Neprosin PEP catalytic domain-containing protein n=1 Tax=Selaginella moellendorffii TaxID=88036 RepID=D8RUB5_SELML|nr:uncharacterized protein LOC9636891 [Selaginella moellendorffii]EFJ24376.1 hypothetical protein SELMODRAFT_415011 [Selaginella moellendorffii]|eukprot:XP_002974856.1 uncharacterized protein LOC9636891 [Selaginella moellendorffii]
MARRRRSPWPGLLLAVVLLVLSLGLEASNPNGTAIRGNLVKLGGNARSFRGRGRGSSRLLKIQKQINAMNKQPVKTIRSPDGDLIDCVLLRNQPAFDHPKLKHHQLQEEPMIWPNNLAKETSTEQDDVSIRVTQMWHQSGKQCPRGTVPIRRTTIDDILRAGSVRRYGRKFHKPPNPSRSNSSGAAASFQASSLMAMPEAMDSNGHEHAIAYTTGQFYGAQASLNVWRPDIDVPNEFSLSQIWLLGGSFADDLNSIEAGWQVSPELYGDSNPRLFTYWTSDSYQATGCYNLLCSGFIQTGSDIAIGASISPVSSYDGPQYDIRILVWKDPRTGNWWMRLGDRTLVGYWPAEIFSHLTDYASMVEFGGEVVNTQPDGSHTATQMGSGRFPSRGFAEASYFRNIGVVDSDNELQSHPVLQTLAEHPNCYGIVKAGSSDWGQYFYYGGPGSNPTCR